MDPAHADDPPTSVQAFVCGLAAGMLAKLGTHPLDVAKKRFQVAGLQRSARYGQVCGWGSGCYKLMLCAAWACTHHLTMHAPPLARFPQLLHPLPCPTPPLLQRVAPEAVRSLRQVVSDIAAKEGAAGLFKGALPSILKAAPSAAVTFAAYDFFLKYLVLNYPAANTAAAAPMAVSEGARRPLH